MILTYESLQIDYSTGLELGFVFQKVIAFLVPTAYKKRSHAYILITTLILDRTVLEYWNVDCPESHATFIAFQSRFAGVVQQYHGIYDTTLVTDL